jgi:hypothetical protein
MKHLIIVVSFFINIDGFTQDNFCSALTAIVRSSSNDFNAIKKGGVIPGLFSNSFKVSVELPGFEKCALYQDSKTKKFSYFSDSKKWNVAYGLLQASKVYVINKQIGQYETQLLTDIMACLSADNFKLTKVPDETIYHIENSNTKIILKGLFTDDNRNYYYQIQILSKKSH